jgi:hypothetical protein
MNQEIEPVNQTMKKIISVTKTEFVTEDGTVHPILFELDEVPTVQEFQEIYDSWLEVFRNKELLHDEPKVS